MKTKLIIVLIITLTGFSQKTNAQNWKEWHTENGVSLYYAYMPSQYGNYPYYLIKIVNRNRRGITFYAKFDFVNSVGQVVTNYDPWHVTIKSGGSFICKKHYAVTNDLKRKAGNAPRLHYSNLRITIDRY